MVETHTGRLYTSECHAVTANSPSCTADIEGNDKEFIFGGKYGYGIANKETGDYRWVKKVWTEDEIKAKKHEKFRGNDGAVDSQGRFWAGFMFDPLVEEMRSDGMYRSFYCSYSGFAC